MIIVEPTTAATGEQTGQYRRVGHELSTTAQWGLARVLSRFGLQQGYTSVGEGTDQSQMGSKDDRGYMSVVCS